jgi:acetate---CoA ligase (ADP-forming)
VNGVCRPPAAQSTSFATTVQGIDSLFAARPDIQEVDLNPVTVYAAGQGALALDALIVMNAPDGRTTS